VRIDSFLRNAFSASRLVAEATGKALVASAQAVRLQAEVVLGLFLRIFLISDNVSSTDNDTLDVTKNLSESPSGSDNDTLDVVKNTSDAGSISDDDVLAIVKALTEQPAFTDAHAFDQTKPLTDSGSVAEDATLQPGKVVADASAFTDNDTLDVTKDVGGDTAQDYCDVTYFLEDYTVGDRLDRIFLGDEEEFTYVKNVSEQIFATDDVDGEASIEDDQEIAFVKTRTEIVAITDVFDRDVAFVRNFSETPAANDSPAKVVGRPASDSGTASDSFSRTVVYLRDFTDLAGTTDTDTIDFGSVKSDDGVFADSEVKSGGKFVTEAPSASSSGSLRSQGYCDFTYFAEDYVGASRTFT